MTFWKYAISSDQKHYIPISKLQQDRIQVFEAYLGKKKIWAPVSNMCKILFFSKSSPRRKDGRCMPISSFQFWELYLLHFLYLPAYWLAMKFQNLQIWMKDKE